MSRPAITKSLMFCVAVYFEQGKYEECIEECNQAVDIGRENRADFQLIAKFVQFSFVLVVHSRIYELLGLIMY